MDFYVQKPQRALISIKPGDLSEFDQRFTALPHCAAVNPLEF
jgi:hypothetical protein